MNGVKLKKNLLNFAIHGKNAEIIHIIEENSKKIDNKSCIELINESIKCHHNEIADYFINNYLHDENLNLFKQSLKYYNFALLQDESIDQCSFKDLCKYDYSMFVDLLLKEKDIDLNNIIIKICKFQ